MASEWHVTYRIEPDLDPVPPSDWGDMEDNPACAQEWADYRNGEVYGIIIEDQDGNHLDSCWGYYGYDWAEQQAKETAAYWQAHPVITYSI